MRIEVERDITNRSDGVARASLLRESVVRHEGSWIKGQSQRYQVFIMEEMRIASSMGL